jgi:predicted Ser/Thr protein kinase
MREAVKIKKYFDRSHHFEFEHYISNGITGVSCKVKFRREWWRFWQRPEYFVVKRSFGDANEENLEHESRILKV